MVDLQRYDRNREDWPEKLFALMVEAYDDWGRTRYPDWPFATAGISNATELENVLLSRHRWLQEQGQDERIIIILDELERVMPFKGEVEAARKFEIAAGALRFLGQAAGSRLISIIAADLRAEVNRRNTLIEGAGTNPFFKFFLEIPLPLLTEEYTSELVESIGRAMGVQVSKELLKKIYQLGGGHPALTRVLASATYRNRARPEVMGINDLKTGYGELLDRDELGSFFRNNLWELMTREEKDAMLSSVNDSLWSRLFSYGRFRKPRYSSSARGNLIAQGLLDERNRIRIGAFSEWMRAAI
jgi:hypothetical protein